MLCTPCNVPVAPSTDLWIFLDTFLKDFWRQIDENFGIFA